MNVPGQERPLLITKLLNCNSDFAIYCLQCPCNHLYVGSTIKKAKLQVLEHMRAIAKNDRTYPVARHFNEKHSGNRDLLHFFCVDRIPPNPRGGDCVRKLRQLESRYIIRLETKAPGGLNQDEELAIHLG